MNTVLVRTNAYRALIFALGLNLLLLAIVISVLCSFFIFDILEVFFLMLKFNLNYLEVSDASFVELREALEGSPRHSVDRLALYVHVLLASHQVLMELVDFVEAGNLSLFIVDNIFLLFLNIVHRSLNLGCQILLQNLKIILLLLILHPMHRLLLFLEDAHFLGG